MFKKILVAFDGSDQSKRALHYSLVLSEKFNSELFILTVNQKSVLPMFNSEEDLDGEEIDSELIEKYWKAKKEYYKNILSEAEEITKRDWSSVKRVTLLVDGRPSTVILSTAQRYEVDLILLGSQGLGNLSGWILGSTSRSVVEHSKRPVFIVK